MKLIWSITLIISFTISIISILITIASSKTRYQFLSSGLVAVIGLNAIVFYRKMYEVNQFFTFPLVAICVATNWCIQKNRVSEVRDNK